MCRVDHCATSATYAQRERARIMLYFATAHTVSVEIEDRLMNSTRRPALRADRGSAYVAIFAVSLALGSASLRASQLYDNDFYSARHTADGARLLAEVERFHMGPGREAMRVGRYPVASREFDFVLRAFPNHPQALLVMGELCSRWKSPVCATQLSLKLEKAVAINPSASGTFVALGAAQQRLGEPKKAIESYQRALELEPDSVNAEYDLALAYCDTKQYDLANEHAQRAYALGATLPGLRGRLVKAGKWKPLDLAQHPGAAPKSAEALGEAAAK